MSNINAKPVAKNKSKLFIFEGSCQFLIPPTGLNFNPIIVYRSERRHLTPEIRVPKYICVSNSNGSNLGCLVTSAKTSGLSSIQGDLGEIGKCIFTSQSN